MSVHFRPEVAKARQRGWMGSISLAQPPRFMIMAAFSVAACLVVISFCVLGNYTRRTTVTGQLVPDLGMATVVAPVSGTVARIDAEEGDQVLVKQTLLQLRSSRVTADGDDALEVQRSSIEARRASLMDAQRSERDQLISRERALVAKITSLGLEIAQIDEEIETRRTQVSLGTETAERFRKVARDGYVSQVQVAQQEQAVLEATGAQQALERQALALRRSLSDVQQSRDEISEQRRILAANGTRDLASLRQEGVQIESSGEMALRSQVSGLVTNRLVEVGQAIQQGQPVITVLPDGSQLQAQLLVTSAAVGFVKAGDTVSLRYEAYPYQKFGSHKGRVILVSRSAIEGGSASPSAGGSLYRVLVRLESQDVLAFGERQPLRPGMRVEADIMGEKRKLYEWVLEPLYSVSGRIGG